MSDLCPVAVCRDDSIEDEFQPKTVMEAHLLLLKEKKYCDVTFTFPNLPDRIEAHEFCLKARSPVFAKIFRMRKTGNVKGTEIQVNVTTPAIFQEFLKFIYSDGFDVDITGALDLLYLSHKYKVHPLTIKCEDFLRTTDIQLQESVKFFEAAYRYGCRELMLRAGQVMVKSFTELVEIDALANAKEETVGYLLERDDLAAPEVKLFEFILEWGRHRVGSSAGKQLLRSTLKNLMSKIRYTNMAPEEFTKVVVPTGLLTPEETVPIFSYFCGDEVTREGLQMKFDTNPRALENKTIVTEHLNFYEDQLGYIEYFPALFRHWISFKVEETTKMWLDNRMGKAAIKNITFRWPEVNDKCYSGPNVLNFHVSIREYSGPVAEGNSSIRFQKTLLNCKQLSWDKVSVEPPVELVSGRSYFVILEDRSTLQLAVDKHRHSSQAYRGFAISEMNREAVLDLGDARLTFKGIFRKTYYHTENLPKWSENIAVIPGMTIGLI